MEKKRAYYLDNIKLILTLLVIAHHSCQAYTIGGDWPVKDVIRSEYISSFLCVNMTFFMGAFFFIAGYFIPKSLESNSTRSYIKKRAKRLLLPVVSLLLFIVPIYMYFCYHHTVNSTIHFIDFYIHVYIQQGMISYDHGWFLVSLFLYSLIYLAIQKPLNHVKGKLTLPKLCLFVVIMSALTAIIRIWYPIDKWIDLVGIVGIEPAHFPQYFLWFIAGSGAYRNHWIEHITPRIGRISCVIGIFTTSIIYLQFVLPIQIIDTVFKCFSLYESIMSVSIIVSLLYLTRIHCNSQHPWIKMLSNKAFFVYIIHNLYVVILQVKFCTFACNVYLKIILITILSIMFSFITAFLYEKIKLSLFSILSKQNEQSHIG